MESSGFDDFLAEATKQAERDAEMQVYIEALNAKLEQALDRHGVPRIASDYPDVQAALLEQATHEYDALLADQTDSSGAPLDPEARAEYARMLANQQMIEEASVLAKVKMAIAVYDLAFKNGEIPDKAITDRNKKQLTASILIERSLPADAPLIAFINDIVPGEPLDTSSRSDDNYIIEALEKHANSAEQQKANHQLTSQAIEIAEKAGKDPVDLLPVFTQLVITAMRYARDGDSANAMRQAKYDEIIRDSALPADIAGKFIQLIHQYYPPSGSN